MLKNSKWFLVTALVVTIVLEAFGFLSDWITVFGCWRHEDQVVSVTPHHAEPPRAQIPLPHPSEREERSDSDSYDSRRPDAESSTGARNRSTRAKNANESKGARLVGMDGPGLTGTTALPPELVGREHWFTPAQLQLLLEKPSEELARILEFYPRREY